MSVQIFAQPPAHHRRIPLVINLPLALLIPALRRDHIDLYSHPLDPTRRLVAEATRFVAERHLLGLLFLFFQPAVKTRRLKPLCRLHRPVIHLAHHPKTLQVHVDGNLAQLNSLLYAVVVLLFHRCRGWCSSASSTTHAI